MCDEERHILELRGLMGLLDESFLERVDLTKIQMGVTVISSTFRMSQNPNMTFPDHTKGQDSSDYQYLSWYP